MQSNITNHTFRTLSQVFAVCLLAWGLPVYADGPVFVHPNDEVEIRDNIPDMLFTDTDTDEADWNIYVDSSVSPSESFSVYNHETATTPFTIENGAPDDALYIDDEGRVGIGTGAPAEELHVAGNTRLDGELSVLSSKAAKENLVPVDSSAVLARLAELPIQEWSYREGDGFRHLGPVAEDFHEVFSLGKSELSINPLDMSGVALAAIQGLQTTLADQQARTERLLAERDREITILSRDRDEMSERLAALEAKLQDLAPQDASSPSPSPLAANRSAY